MYKQVVWEKSLKDCNVVIRSGRISLTDAAFKVGGTIRYTKTVFSEGVLLVDCHRYGKGWETFKLAAAVREGSTIYGFRDDMYLVYYSNGQLEVQIRKEIGNE